MQLQRDVVPDVHNLDIDILHRGPCYIHHQDLDLGLFQLLGLDRLVQFHLHLAYFFTSFFIFYQYFHQFLLMMFIVIFTSIFSLLSSMNRIVDILSLNKEDLVNEVPDDHSLGKGILHRDLPHIHHQDRGRRIVRSRHHPVLLAYLFLSPLIDYLFNLLNNVYKRFTRI